MATGIGNALNEATVGLVRNLGSGIYDAVTTTPFNVLVGAASNGITNVTPVANNFVLASTGLSSLPTFRIVSATNIYQATAVSVGIGLQVNIVGVTSTASARTITMPLIASTAVGQTWTIKDESLACSANNITIDGNGANILSNVSSGTYIMNTDGASVTLYSNGTAYVII